MHFHLGAVVHFDVSSTENALNFAGRRASIRGIDSISVLF